MGYRTLIEISHDSAHKLREQPQGFVERLYRYCCAASSETREALDRFDDVRVVAMRHSADSYIISNKAWGFPSKLPFEEEHATREMKRTKALEYAKSVIPAGKGTTKDQLLLIIADLLEES